MDEVKVWLAQGFGCLCVSLLSWISSTYFSQCSFTRIRVTAVGALLCSSGGVVYQQRFSGDKQLLYPSTSNIIHWERSSSLLVKLVIVKTCLEELFIVIVQLFLPRTFSLKVYYFVRWQPRKTKLHSSLQ